MEEMDITSKYYDSVDAVWRIVDKNLPYPASTVVRAAARDEEMAKIGRKFYVEAGEFAIKMMDIIEERTGIEFSQADFKLLCCAVFHQVMCSQIDAFQTVDITQVADVNPLIALEMSGVLFKEHLRE